MAEQRGNQQKGFGGFDSLVSDITDLPEVKPTFAPPLSDPTRQEKRKTARPAPTPAPIKNGANGSLGRIWTIGVVLAVVVVEVVINMNYDSRSRVAVSPNHPTTVIQPSASQTPPPALAVQPKTSAPVAELGEVRPPVGTDNYLNADQVRYCLEQNVRIDGAHSAVNQYSQVDIDRYKELIEDYNSRCSSFRYKQGVLERERMNVESQRMLLESEGSLAFRADVMKRAAQAKSAPSPATTTAIAPTSSLVPKPTRKPSVPQYLSLPDNAEPDRAGLRPWICRRGFKEVGSECVAVRIPANAQLDYLGNDWVCQLGFQHAGNECLPVKMPPNAQLDYNWICTPGFARIGIECLRGNR